MSNLITSYAGLLLLFLTAELKMDTVRGGGEQVDNLRVVVKESMETPPQNGHLTTNNYVRDLVTHPAFQRFGDLLLPWDDNSRYYDTRLRDVSSLMPYHSHVKPAIVVGALNRLIDDVDLGKTVFYDVYAEPQKRTDRAKNLTGLFFYRGKPGAPFAIVCPGGGFSYVGSLHEGFPLAWEISKKGLNAFVLRYRVGEQVATQDMAAAIGYIVKNARTLDVNPQGYALWGGSAGARMVGNIALNGVASYGGENLPGPATVVIAYTGQASYSAHFPPTFITVSADDPIANVTTVDRRVQHLKNAGVAVEYRRYNQAGHGFGLGVGTDADGWLQYAIKFWEVHLPKR